MLAGGSGKRFGSEIPKQYIEVNGRPLLYYTLKAFEDSCVEGIVIVAGREWMRFVIDKIVDRFSLKKVISVCQGGAERFDSVYHALDDLGNVAAEEDTVLIHDGARPLIKPGEINIMAEAVSEFGAAIAAMPVKDTIKISDDEGFVAATTVRANTWQIQTPQAFRYGLIKNAYDSASEMLWKSPVECASDTTSHSEGKPALVKAGAVFTDDSMVVEAVCPQQKIRLVRTSYENIKITTPEDLEVAKARLKC